MEVKKVKFNVLLSEEDIKRLEEVAREKYRIPGNKSHAIRLLIEDAYKELEGGKNG
jgi:hypothetical protein